MINATKPKIMMSQINSSNFWIFSSLNNTYLTKRQFCLLTRGQLVFQLQPKFIHPRVKKVIIAIHWKLPTIFECFIFGPILPTKVISFPGENCHLFFWQISSHCKTSKTLHALSQRVHVHQSSCLCHGVRPCDKVDSYLLLIKTYHSLLHFDIFPPHWRSLRLIHPD